MNKEGLSVRIGRTFTTVLRRAILIVCLESIIISATVAVMYTMKDNHSSVSQYTQEIDSSMQSKVSMLEAIAAGISSGTLTEREEIQNYVDSMVAMDDQISAVYSCYDENITVMSGGWEPPADFIVTDREWYKEAQADPDHVFISEPYVDEQSGGICITLAKATFRNGKMAGVTGMDMYMDDLVSLIESSYDGGNYIFLVSGEGTILTHPDSSVALTVGSSSHIQDAYQK